MTTLIPGTRVEARGLEWEVVHSEAAGGQQRYRLRCQAPDLRGFEVDLLHPFEEIRPLVTELDPTRAGRLAQWRLYHHAFLLEQALGPGALMAVQPGRLDIAPYQLVPVMRTLRMGRPRLLLADGVGLGKTVEAGLIMAELIARRRAHRILVVCPPGPLLEQWYTEMRERFGLRFQRVRSASDLQEMRRSLVLGANPFDHLSYCLMSVDFAKQEKVLQDLERSAWDLVVIDEAHHCAKLGSAGVWDDSRRRRLAEVLARQSDGLLLLTATPHDGYDAHFASILELLDPSLVDGRGALRGERYRAHVVRRLKQHIKDPVTGNRLFKERVVSPVPVPFSMELHPDFSLFQQALLAAIAPRLRLAVRQRRFGEVLAFVSLLKRSVSTAAACRNTLQVVKVRYDELVKKGAAEAEDRDQRMKSLREYRKRMERYGTLSYEAEQDQAMLEAEEMASDLIANSLDSVVGEIAELTREQDRTRRQARRVAGTSDILDTLVDLAAAAALQDPKLKAVLDEIITIRSQEPDANVLVYTEYTDSQKALKEYLEAALQDGRLGGQLSVICGDDSETDRGKVTKRFSSQSGIVLISTDATSEGLNLQERCHHLIHLELPYNPNRLEQRNGRIDRYGQTETPMVKYLYLAGTFEERLLIRLVAKYERQRARLTFVPDTLGGITSDDAQTARLLQGLCEEQQSLFKRSPAPLLRIEEHDEDVSSGAYKDLLDEIEHSMASFEKTAKTQSWLAESGLNAEEQLLKEATKALSTGQQLGAVDLLRFVKEAVVADTGNDECVRHFHANIELELLPLWAHGMEEMPGFDHSSRVLRVTTDKGATLNGAGQPLGYLGRAHPIVRRAIDRVRSIRFGEADSWVDRRVSTVMLPVQEPALLFTYLGVVESPLGHEYERVLAVEVNQAGQTTLHEQPEQWLTYAEAGQACDSTGKWKELFLSWADQAAKRALVRAGDGFTLVSEAVVKSHLTQVDEELASLESWLAVRAQNLCGPVRQAAVTGDLFSLVGSGQRATELPRWQVLTSPGERLAAFATDATNSSVARKEADGVLRLYHRRLAQLQQRQQVRVLPPLPLGLLMILPLERGGF